MEKQKPSHLYPIQQFFLDKFPGHGGRRQQKLTGIFCAAQKIGRTAVVHNVRHVMWRAIVLWLGFCLFSGVVNGSSFFSTSSSFLKRCELQNMRNDIC